MRPAGRSNPHNVPTRQRCAQHNWQACRWQWSVGGSMEQCGARRWLCVRVPQHRTQTPFIVTPICLSMHRIGPYPSCRILQKSDGLAFSDYDMASCSHGRRHGDGMVWASSCQGRASSDIIPPQLLPPSAQLEPSSYPKFF